ncbi:MAG: hypothetical protein SFY80_10740 [Verrucomicrobiota bacterium]|nr:hypothetical protein [Verrucomicrobiota bacterium]
MHPNTPAEIVPNAPPKNKESQPGTAARLRFAKKLLRAWSAATPLLDEHRTRLD